MDITRRWEAVGRGLEDEVRRVVELRDELASSNVRGVDHLCASLTGERWLDRVLETHAELHLLRYVLERVSEQIARGAPYDVDALIASALRAHDGRTREARLAPLLADLASAREEAAAPRLVPLFSCHVAGTTYRSLDRVLGADGSVVVEAAEAELTLGEALRLEREPMNRWDPRAIRVLSAKDRWLGYVPRARSEIAANLLDDDAPVLALLDGAHRHAHGWLELRVTVCLAVKAGGSCASSGGSCPSCP